MTPAQQPPEPELDATQEREGELFSTISGVIGSM